MNARFLFPKEYLATEDLGGKEVTLTISKLVSEEVRTEKGEVDKWIIHFKEMEERVRKDRKQVNKRLPLNKTNAKSIQKLYGSETDDWLGKKITLYPTSCMAFGKEAA